METANLIFQMTHPAPSDLDAATALARAIVDQVSAAAPADTWRAEENADPVTVDYLKELVIPNETSVERAVMGYGWGIGSGQPPRDLYVQMSIGVRGTTSSGKAQLGFDDRGSLDASGGSCSPSVRRPWNRLLSAATRCHSGSSGVRRYMSETGQSRDTCSGGKNVETQAGSAGPLSFAALRNRSLCPPAWTTPRDREVSRRKVLHDRRDPARAPQRGPRRREDCAPSGRSGSRTSSKILTR